MIYYVVKCGVCANKLSHWPIKIHERIYAIYARARAHHVQYQIHNVLGVSVRNSDHFLSMLTQYYMRQGCVAVMSTTWIASVAIFGVLVLPRGGYYFNGSGLLACDPFFARASLRYRHDYKAADKIDISRSCPTARRSPTLTNCEQLQFNVENGR